MESTRKNSNVFNNAKVHWSPDLIFESSTKSCSSTESRNSQNTTSSDTESENGATSNMVFHSSINHTRRFTRHVKPQPSVSTPSVSSRIKGRPKKKVTFDDQNLILEPRSHRQNKKPRNSEVVVVTDDECDTHAQIMNSRTQSNDKVMKNDVDMATISTKEKLENWKNSGPDMCCICLDESSTQSNDELVWCDGDYCEVSVHRTCYGLGPILKDKNWYCDRCASNKEEIVTCLLCPSITGAFWRVQDVPGGWVHVICAMWIIKADLDDDCARDKVKISGILSKSWQTKCSVCDEVEALQGVSIKCEAGKCRNRLHISCAYDYGLYDTWHDIGTTTILCKKHTKDPIRLNVWKLWVNRRDRMLDQSLGIYCRSHYQSLDTLCIGSIQRNIAELTCENAALERSLRTQEQKSRRLKESITHFTNELQDAEQELSSLQNILLQSFRGLQITDQQLRELELSEENVINYFLTEVTSRGFQPGVLELLKQKHCIAPQTPIDTSNIVKNDSKNQGFWEELFGNSPSNTSTEEVILQSSNLHTRSKNKKIKCSICWKLNLPFSSPQNSSQIAASQGKTWNAVQESYGFVNNAVINRQYRRLILIECSSCKRHFHMLCLKPTLQKDLTEEELRTWKCNSCL